MAGQLCGICGNSPFGRCRCTAADDDETAVIPIIGGPELVRPYVHSGAAVEFVEVWPYEEIHAGEPAFARERPHAHEPGHRAEPLTIPVVIPRQGGEAPEIVLATYELSGSAYRGSGYSGGGFDGSGLGGRVGAGRAAGRRAAAAESAGARRRRTLLLAAGAMAVAGLGIAAAALPSLLGGGRIDEAMPQPAVTSPLPSAGPDTASPSTSAQPTADSSARPAASAVRARHSTKPSAGRSGVPGPTGRPQPPGPQVSASGTPGVQATPTPSTAPSTPPSPAAQQTLREGDSGPAVATMQRELDNWINGYVSPDGYYGRRTVQAVAEFQRQYGVQGDEWGVYGPNTQATLAGLQNGG